MTDNICCGTIEYLIRDDRIYQEEGGKYQLWTSRDPEGDKWKPQLIDLNYCPSCGKKLR